VVYIPEAGWQAFHQRINDLIIPPFQDVEYTHQHSLIQHALVAAVALIDLIDQHR